MNIISNNCFHAFCYKWNNVKFNNPFVWTRIFLPDYYELITNYDTLDFENVEYKPDKCFVKDITVQVMLNDIPIHFGHHHFSLDETPRKSSVDIFYRHIFNMVCDAWERRVKRIPNEEPGFIIWQDSEILSAELLNKFLEIKNKKLFIILSDVNLYNSIKDKETANYKVVYNAIAPCHEVYASCWNDICQYFQLHIS